VIQLAPVARRQGRRVRDGGVRVRRDVRVGVRRLNFLVARADLIPAAVLLVDT